MDVELITGHAGTDHIGADEARMFLRGIAGVGCYYLEDAPGFRGFDPIFCSFRLLSGLIEMEH